jgi:hypothetical protein
VAALGAVRPEQLSFAHQVSEGDGAGHVALAANPSANGLSYRASRH